MTISFIASTSQVLWRILESKGISPTPAFHEALVPDAIRGQARVVDLATAIRAATMDSAYLMNQGQQVGNIKVGKRADMIVVDQNLFDVPATKIGASKVFLTVLDGKVVGDAASARSSSFIISRPTFARRPQHRLG